jgi:glycine/D-amino acid oxidase-like deaminating enzyme
MQHQDAEAAKQALRDAIDLAELRSKAQEAGLNPDEVVAGYQSLRDSQLSPADVLKSLKRAPITG